MTQPRSFPDWGFSFKCAYALQAPLVRLLPPVAPAAEDAEAPWHASCFKGSDAVALRQTLSDGYDERRGFFVLRPEACYEVTMPFEIQWTGHQGAAKRVEHVVSPMPTHCGLARAARGYDLSASSSAPMSERRRNSLPG
jgi:hypothetical protein